MATKFGAAHHLLPPTYKRLVSSWLEEDCPSFDYGGFVVGEGVKEARLLGKSPVGDLLSSSVLMHGLLPFLFVVILFSIAQSYFFRIWSGDLIMSGIQGMLAGVPFFDEVFRQLDCTVEWHISEGEVFEPIKHCATVRGPINKILLGERVALNTLARCSGIATKTFTLLSLLHTHSTHLPHPPTLAGTRKTTPGFRIPEKYALLIGGADPHRQDLSSMTMLKDNHIWACAGNIARAVHTAKSAGGFSVKVEVECQSEGEAVEAVRAGADVVMLDNFAPGQELESAVRRLRARFSDKVEYAMEGVGFEESREFLVEVSGGLTEENVKGYVVEGVDVISTSSIHQGVKHVDFSLKVVH
ncbi:MAG: hypothetical protein Q9209_002911 [Squamulea sp. 1 TL-2023]